MEQVGKIYDMTGSGDIVYLSTEGGERIKINLTNNWMMWSVSYGTKG